MNKKIKLKYAKEMDEFSLQEVEKTVYTFDCPYCSKKIESVNEDSAELDKTLHIQMHEINWLMSRKHVTRVKCSECEGYNTRILTVSLPNRLEHWKCDDCDNVFKNRVGKHNVYRMVQ